MTNYVNQTLGKTLKKYFQNSIDSNVLFSKDTFNFKCEISIFLENSIFIKSHALSNDAYGAFNIACERIKKRIRRFHRKLIDHRAKSKKTEKFLEASQYIIENPEKNEKKIDSNDDPVIIAESEELIKTLSVSEALMLMSLNEQNAIFFKNLKTRRLNILYKRIDGNVGWLDPKK